MNCGGGLPVIYFDIFAQNFKLISRNGMTLFNEEEYLPVATHFSETVGPGCRVCSENQYTSSGEASLGNK